MRHDSDQDQPNLDQINWTQEYTGAGVLLGNIDGYPAVDHPDLEGQVTVYNPHRVTFGPYSWNADHASGCAGIAVGKKNNQGIVGVAPGAHMIVAPYWKSTDRAVWGTAWGRTSALSKAYSHFASKGVRCVNRELNSTRSPYGLEAIWGTTADLDLVARYDQFVHVQSAGNDGKPIANQVYYKPAETLDHLLIVVGVDGNNKIWPRSNTPQSRSLYIPNVRPIPPANLLKNFVVSAPATAIVQPASPTGYNWWYGTSFAAPAVQGLVALMYEKAARLGIALTPQGAARIIKETCTKIGPSEIYGHGLINVKAALERVQ